MYAKARERRTHYIWKLGKVVLLAQRKPAVYPEEMLGFCNDALDVLLLGIVFIHVAIKRQKRGVIRSFRS